MRWLSAAALGSVALVGFSVAQEEQSTYCDSLGRCFASHTNEGGITYGFAIPEGATSGSSYDAIVQITAPISVGWAGLAWGGSMTYNPLTIVWVNGEQVTVSSRIAFGYFTPPPYDGAEYTVLPGTVVNSTHFAVTALCKGCTYFAPFGNDPTALNPDGENYLAFAYSGVPVDDPSSNETTFGIHERVGHWNHNFEPAKAADFEVWAAGDGGGSEPPSSTTTLTTVLTATSTATVRSTTTLQTTVTRTGFPSSSVTATASASRSTSASVSTSASASNNPVLPLPSSCSGVSPFRFGFQTAAGWKAVKLAGSLSAPRGVAVDSNGNLLVVQSGKGVTIHTFGSNGCISSSKMLIDNPTLNHGIGFTPDGKTLYVSSMTTAWSYAYNAQTQSVSGQTVVVRNMQQGGHPTRALVIPPATPHLLVIQQGSYDNFDYESLNKAVGRAVVKVFDMRNVPSGGWAYASQGWFLGWGLRNEVALSADGNNMIWGVENSGDNFARTVNGRSYDIHNDNPAEELNFLGDPSKPNEDWYGYPTCYTVWEPSVITDKAFSVGAQFVVAPNNTFNDDTCTERSIAPRLSFQAHSAPIGSIFDKDFTNLYVTLHGSWNRSPATGFKVSVVPFTKLANGQYDPVAPPDSKTGYSDIFWSTNVASCTASTCFRPSGIIWDRSFSRLFVASDNTQEGELFMLYKS
ncbi:carbohydrate-binding cytochrome b562-like protein [Colletotrichum truncatum]|uniref:Carbohydrate-binding cytochrome b562-like protein n=1 Tax=Colletotrichum truncatum TaxID=5467 RepID=A0ACC3YR27_COLTU|nr:carbohydrate-binding cytochrome b562-like protein [Colletotrichum truncatum]KAF6781134.1 carbohydrate-binding cytochrome b562-like protein [Colletotrichum truncatum]